MSIPPRFLDEIRNRLPLSDVIGKRIRITRAGREFKACCPFHKEKTPSFTINDDKQFFHCFGCGAHGDVIGFVMQHDNLSFIDAVSVLAAQAGLQMPETSPEDIQKAKKAKDLYALMDSAARWMQNQLMRSENRDVYDYLTDRGLKPEIIEAFRIGFAPDDRHALKVYLKSEGFAEKDMIEAGVLKISDKGGEPYVFFRGRVMFPVADRRGRVVAFGGRALPDHLRRADDNFTPAKYINSPDTPLFDKSRILYGESLVRQSVREGHSLMVTEGYMDVIACHQAGFKGAVAPMGTALTEEQIMLLWSIIPEDEKFPVLCFDGDNAGRKAAGRACERIMPLLKAGQSARFVFLPEGEDPDTLIKSGGMAAFQNILKNALSLFDFLWVTHTAGRKFDTPEARAGLVKTLQNQIRTIADREVQKHYMALLNEKVSETFFRRRADGKSGGSPPKLSALKPRKPVFQDIHQRILLAAVLNHPHIYDMIEEDFCAFPVAQDSLNRLRQEMTSALVGDPALDREALHHHLKDRGLEKEMDDILSESVYVHAAFAAPNADSGLVAGKWMELWDSIKERDINREMQSGWKSAFYASSEEEEERLKRMMQVNTQRASKN